MSGSTNMVVIIGAVLALLGITTLAIPIFTTTQTKDVADIGDLHVTAKEQDTHVVPPLLSEGALAIGVVLIGVGLVSRR